MMLLLLLLPCWILPNNKDKMKDLSSTILSKYTDGDLGPFIYYYLIRHKHKSVLHDSAASYVDAWSMHGCGEHAPEIQQPP